MSLGCSFAPRPFRQPLACWPRCSACTPIRRPSCPQSTSLKRSFAPAGSCRFSGTCASAPSRRWSRGPRGGWSLALGPRWRSRSYSHKVRAMPSSTFNSKAGPAARDAGGGAASPRGLERPVPAQPWLRTLAVVACATLIGTTGWEIAMRQFGLRAGDLDDGKAHWAVERRKVDEGPREPIVIIGDSRILFDTDLATWQTLSGRRPIQLALVGTSARPFLHDLAMDDHFAGLLVI